MNFRCKVVKSATGPELCSLYEQNSGDSVNRIIEITLAYKVPRYNFISISKLQCQLNARRRMQTLESLEIIETMETLIPRLFVRLAVKASCILIFSEKNG